MTVRRLCISVGLGLTLLQVASGRLRADSPAESELESVRAAITKAISLLEKGARGSMEQRSNCFTCHNQGIPLIALTTARARGFKIDDNHVQEQAAFIARFLERNRARFLEGKGTGGEIATAGTALWALGVAEWKPDEQTSAVAEYLLLFDPESDHWRMTSDRPPSEHSDFTATFLAIRGLQEYANEAQRERREQRWPRARKWLLDTPVQETEDRVFRLWGLKSVGADQAQLLQAREDLLHTQREDGGWSQTEAMKSDAYATGTALSALALAGDLSTDAPAYRRGLAFLLETQQADGSWHVVSRSKPFQTYFESGFPHGTDQFISITATAWATTALSLALPVAHVP